MEKTGCKITCGAPTTLAVKGLMMMIKFSSMVNLTFLMIVIIIMHTNATCRAKMNMIDVFLRCPHLSLANIRTILV